VHPKGRKPYWRSIIEYPNDLDANGKPKREQFTGATQAEAEAKREAKIRWQQGRPSKLERQDVALAFRQWLERRKVYLAPRSYESWFSIIERHLVPALGHKDIAAVTRFDIEGYLVIKREREGLSSSSVNHHLKVIKALFSELEAENLVAKSPAKAIKPLRHTDAELDAARARWDLVPDDPETIAKILAAAQGDYFEAACVLAMMSAMREGEILGLQWEDIDFEQRKLIVHHSLQEIEGKLTLTRPKTKKSNRPVPLNDEAIAALKAHRQRTGGIHGLVFRSADGRPVRKITLWRHWKAILRRAGLDELIRFHDLRHQVVHRLVPNPNVTIKQVTDLLGHSSTSFTMDYYQHLKDRDRANTVAYLSPSKNVGNAS
jgi:integrase